MNSVHNKYLSHLYFVELLSGRRIIDWRKQSFHTFSNCLPVDDILVPYVAVLTAAEDQLTDFA